MTSTLMQEQADTSEYIVLEPWLHVPSGGNSLCALEPLAAIEPSGSQSGYLNYALPGGFVVALVFATASLAGGTPNALHTSTRPSTTHVATAPAITLRRREDDEERSTDRAAASMVVEPGDRSLGTRADETSIDELDISTAGEYIDAIQDALSLTVTQVAAILGVSRATVHAWIRGDVPAPRNPAVAQRLRGLNRLGMVWREYSAEDIGRFLNIPLRDGEASLLDLLHATNWDEEQIKQALGVLAHRLELRRAERADRAARGEPTARPVTPETVELERQRLRALVQRGRYYGR